jgi:hypothetical protein
MEFTKMSSRRDFLKKGVYAAPAIITLSAVPAFAGVGSDRHKNTRGRGHHERGTGNGKGRGKGLGKGHTKD